MKLPVEWLATDRYRSLFQRVRPSGSESTARVDDCFRMGSAGRIAQTSPTHDTRLYRPLSNFQSSRSLSLTRLGLVLTDTVCYWADPTTDLILYTTFSNPSVHSSNPLWSREKPWRLRCLVTTATTTRVLPVTATTLTTTLANRSFRLRRCNYCRVYSARRQCFYRFTCYLGLCQRSHCLFRRKIRLGGYRMPCAPN
jgi:hypothetical protein